MLFCIATLRNLAFVLKPSGNEVSIRKPFLDFFLFLCFDNCGDLMFVQNRFPMALVDGFPTVLSLPVQSVSQSVNRSITVS